jgi:hypothetical protein
MAGTIILQHYLDELWNVQLCDNTPLETELARKELEGIFLDAQSAVRVEAFEEAARVCEAEAERIGKLYPDAHMGNFAKKVGRNALLGAAAMIRKKAKE